MSNHALAFYDTDREELGSHTDRNKKTTGVVNTMERGVKAGRDLFVCFDENLLATGNAIGRSDRV